jgi:hypothetical protein
MTFPDRIHPEAAGKLWRVFLRQLPPTRWARALEYQKRGVLHYHALVWFGGGQELRRLSFMDRWYALAGGFARIVAYDPARGAGFYLGKYVSKGGEVDLGGPWWR